MIAPFNFIGVRLQQKEVFMIRFLLNDESTASSRLTLHSEYLHTSSNWHYLCPAEFNTLLRSRMFMQ